MWIVGRLKKSGHKRLTCVALSTVAGSLAVVLIVELAAPLRKDTGFELAMPAGADTPPALPDAGASAAPAEPAAVLATVRQGMFRSAAPLQDRPLADKTIEKIRSQLTLRCILEVYRQPVAYIQIKDAGLERCKVGDSVRDLFTILDIHPKSVDLNILDHRVTLSL